MQLLEGCSATQEAFSVPIIPLITSLLAKILPSWNQRASLIAEKMIEIPQSEYGKTAQGKVLKIYLNDQERKLIGLLRDFITKTGTNCILRIAGGWVRDKLLGLPSDDLDIAVDSMTGVELAAKLHEYMHEYHLPEHKIAIIQTNPDKSKHLETATTKIFGMHVDFVNLRAESYAEGSRIPDKVSFGTALQDAFRRDITINSLFFNVHSLLVEDLTGKGLRDLREGKVMTPLEPRTTFLDDPLRIMRAIRFSCRFSYKIDEGIFAACKAPEIRRALAKKVSKERIGIELIKTFKGPSPFDAIGYLLRLEVADVIFTLSPQEQLNAHYHAQTQHYAAKLQAILGAEKTNCILSIQLTSEEIPIFYLSVCLLHYVGEPIGAKTSAKAVTLASQILREALKLSNQYSTAIQRLFVAHDSFSRYLHLNPALWTRKQTGLLLMSVQELWRISLLLAYLHSNSLPTSQVTAFLEHVSAVQLDNCYKMHPILNGNEIAALLQKPPGKFVGSLLQELVEWQLENGIQPGMEEQNKQKAQEFILQHLTPNKEPEE